MKTFFALLLMMTGFYAHVLTAQPELKGSPDELRSFLYPHDKLITIEAEAEEKAYTDKARLSLVITTEGKQLSQAISANQALRDTIIQSLLQRGIEPQDIRNSKFSSSPEYFWLGNKPSKYKVMNRIAVSVFQEKHVQDVAEIADQHEEVRLSDTVFEHTQKDQYNQKVRAQALKKIMQQKLFYEQSLAIKLTAVDILNSRINQRGTSGALTMIRAMPSKAEAYNDPVTNDSVAVQQAQSSHTMPQSSFDEISYHASLAVRFKIEQRH